MTKLRKTALACGTACALALTGGLAALNTLPAVAEEGDTAVTRGYYGEKLEDGSIAQAFYDELIAMAKPRIEEEEPNEPVPEAEEGEEGEGGGESGEEPGGEDPGEEEPGKEPTTLPSEFQAGEAHTVTNTAILELAVNYETGDTALVKAFGAALDSFRYDYVDLFYIDFDALTFTVTKSVKEEEGEPAPEAEEEGEEPVVVEYVYGVTIGAKDYFLSGINAENVAEKITAYTAELDKVKTGLSLTEEASAKEKAVAVSKALFNKLTYGYGEDALASTAYSLVGETASSAGAARAFKAVMNSLDEKCELVSGYYVQNGVTKNWTWNYVKDGEAWYAVDVAANLVAKSEKYVNVTNETFNLDHFEDRVVSLSKYKLEYPTLAAGKLTVDDGALAAKEETVEERAALVLSYEGIDVDKVLIRVKEDGEFGEWQTIKAYAEIANAPESEPAPEAEEDEGGEGGGESGEEPAPEVLPNVVIDEENEVAYFYALQKADCEFSFANDEGMRYVPVVIGASDKSLTPQEITSTATTVTIKYAEALEKIDADKDIEIVCTVETLSGEKVEGVSYQIEKVELSEDGLTVKFDFTPSNELQHNALRYTFTPANLAVIKTETIEQEKPKDPVPEAEEGSEEEGEGGEEGGEEPAPEEPTVIRTTVALPYSYSLVFGLKAVVAEKVYGGNGLYTDIVTKPSLALNSELSLDGWKYGDDKTVGENMRSSLTLVSTKPTTAVDDIKKDVNKYFVLNDQDGALKEVVPYNVGLTLDGYAVTVPDNAYLKLAFPYPADYAPSETDAGVVFKVLQFKRGEDGAIDYTNPTVVDAVATRQGIVAAVNGLDTFAVVVLDKAKIGDDASVKSILTQTSGVGGKVTTDGNKPVNTLDGAEASITYTLTPDAGYKVGFVTVNGKEVEVTDNKVTISYTDLVQGEEESLEQILNNVLQVEFVKEDADELATEVAKNFASGFVQNVQLSAEPYGASELAELNSVVYPSGIIGTETITPPGIVNPPIEPTPGEPIDTATTKMQYIILAAVAGGLILIGVIAIIYCGAIRPKIIREREEEAARIAANRERRANRNRMGGSRYDPNNPRR